MLNQSAEYALKVVALIASRPGDVPSRAAELAAALELPANYLSKILHQLASAGVLISRKGRGGGFLLTRGAAQLTLAAVVTPFEELGRYRSCFLGNAICSDRRACVAHDRWKPIARAVLGFLQETTIDSIATSAARPEPPSTSGAKRPRARSRRPT